MFYRILERHYIRNTFYLMKISRISIKKIIVKINYI